MKKGGCLPDAAPAELQVASQVAAAVVGTFQMQASALDQPIYLEFQARVDEVVEISAGMLEGQGIWVGELLTDKQMYFGREVLETGGHVLFGTKPRR